MTVALNYAASAVESLTEKLHIFDEIDRRAIEELIAQIRRSVHFSVPDNGSILDDNWKGLRSTEVRLPFPEITVEYFVSVQETSPKLVHAPKRLIVAAMERVEDLRARMANHPVRMKIPSGIESEWLIRVNAVSDFGQGYGWVPMGGSYFILCSEWDDYEGKMDIEPIGHVRHTTVGIAGFPAIFLPGMCVEYLKKLDGNMTEFWRHLANDVGAETSTTMELCEALSCSNVGIATIQRVKDSVNARRVRDGKLSLFEIKTLSITVPETRQGGGASREYLNRASPRQHLRRGHIRRLADGRKIMIPSCVVGSTGRVEKSYSIVRPD